MGRRSWAAERCFVSVEGVFSGSLFCLTSELTSSSDGSHTFHILHSFPLPSSAPPSSSASNTPPAQPTLTLRVPGKPAPIPIPSLRLLEEFLGEEVERALRGRGGKGKVEKQETGGEEVKEAEEQEEEEEDDEMEEV